jgi:hypothetical protein
MNFVFVCYPSTFPWVAFEPLQPWPDSLNDRSWPGAPMAC